MNPSTSSIPTKSAVELKQLDIQPTLLDVVSKPCGFEDFSMHPPDELLTKSKRVTSTSLVPPTKRRKNLVAPKPIPVEPESSTPADGIHAPHYTPVATETDFLEKSISVSSDKNLKEHLVKADLKKFKTYFKKYVSISLLYFLK